MAVSTKHGSKIAAVIFVQRRKETAKPRMCKAYSKQQVGSTDATRTVFFKLRAYVRLPSSKHSRYAHSSRAIFGMSGRMIGS